ncbi:MAG: DUF2946 family protein [Betaproteobacteria bacterium]|nr:DUF2946 family protein [Betaproteobacteria bacterium]MDH3436273.1 DUF2946 family protein [Betaproteobacteria bacterium]
MDEIVLRGMAKWPDVPAVYGWLSLDRRGHWLIKGDRIANSGVIAFIGRNYTHDEQGRWFFQNGPQRVFVALEHAPFVYRVVNSKDAALEIESHVGKPVTAVSGAWIDEMGVVLLETEHGIGTIHDGDLDRLLPSFVDANGTLLDETALDELLELVEGGQSVALWLTFRQRNIKVEPIRSATVPGRFGFIAHPVQPAGQPECC